MKQTREALEALRKARVKQAVKYWLGKVNYIAGQAWVLVGKISRKLNTCRKAVVALFLHNHFNRISLQTAGN